MPLDESADRGNVLIDEMGRAHVFRDNQAAREALDAEPERWSVSIFISHHAEGQCPQGRAWQGKKRTDRDAPQAPPEPAQGSLL